MISTPTILFLFTIFATNDVSYAEVEEVPVNDFNYAPGCGPEDIRKKTEEFFTKLTNILKQAGSKTQQDLSCLKMKIETNIQLGDFLEKCTWKRFDDLTSAIDNNPVARCDATMQKEKDDIINKYSEYGEDCGYM